MSASVEFCEPLCGPIAHRLRLMVIPRVYRVRQRAGATQSESLIWCTSNYSESGEIHEWDAGPYILRGEVQLE